MKKRRSLSRREFLKDSVLSGGALVFLNGMGPLRGITTGGSNPQVFSRHTLLEGFRNPSAEYGEIDCWWWEAGHLTEEKMRWELEELKDKGLAGTFLYPRYINNEPLRSDPPYWTEEWWERVRFTMESQQQLGLRSWFSDWTGLQFVQDRLRKEANPELVGHRLVIHQKESQGRELVEIEVPPTENILSAAAYKKQKDGLDYSSRGDLLDAVHNHTLRWNAPEAGWLVAVVASQPHDLDYLNRAVADRWLEIYFEEYAKRLPGFLGKTLVAYGPDEGWMLMGNAFYSRSLAENVRSERGYDIAPHLIALFHDIGPKTDQIRCDYYGALSALVEENFYKPFAEWLHQHGMKYVTIATQGRENLLEQTYEYGDFFRYARWFDVTGNEDPGQENIPERHFVDAKLSSSVAHLYPTKRVGVCTYWGSGWGMTQEENVAWTNGNYAWGVNLFNRDGVLYTLMGGWYEYVPPCVAFYQPYWQYFKVFTDYVRRLSYVMSQGVHRADVAVLYPLTTFHANWIAGKVSGMFGGDNYDIFPAFNQHAQEAAQMTMNLARRIYQNTIDLDFIDYHSLERSTVEDGKLRVSDLEFRVLVLPPMTTVRIPTLRKIRDFQAAGGTVIAFGRLPGGSAENGRDDPEIRDLISDVFGIVPEQSVAQTIERRNRNRGTAFFVPEDIERVPEIIPEIFTPDMVCNEGNLYYTHQKIGELEVYFLVNIEGEYRRLTVSFRAVGDLEIWDPLAGKVEKEYRTERQGERTEVRLAMAPYQGAILVFSPGSTRAEVWEDNLTEISGIEATPEGFTIRGLDESGGAKGIRLRQGGKEFTAAMTLSPPPLPLRLEGPFSSQIQPTMNNRWGDFRYPASEELIGPEARTFKYMEEGPQPGDLLGWHEPQFDDSTWPVARYSYGPYWWHIGPFEEGREPAGLEEKARNGELASEVYESGGKSLRWEPYTFSQEFGYFEEIQQVWAGLLGVSENFFVLPNRNLPKASHFLCTFVNSPEEGNFTLYFGGTPEKAAYPGEMQVRYQVPDQRQAWVNGDQVLDIREKRTDEVSGRVHLKKGWNAVLLKLVLRAELPATSETPSENGPGIATYAVIRASAPPPGDPYVPRVRWFADGQTLTYDISANKKKRVGWYRFKAPPGLAALRLNVKAKQVDAWIDGQPVPVENSKIRLNSVIRKPSQVALRVDQEPGTYAGAAFPEPIAYECKEGEIALGNWSPQGLESYSGAVLYGTVVTLNKEHLKASAVLDLGMVKTCAEVHVNGKLAGVRLARPFRFEVTDLVREGENEIQIRVVNTLANHMSSYPTKFVYKGQNSFHDIPDSVRTRGNYPAVLADQTISGLLGPVQLRFLSKVNLLAKLVKSNA
jgi:hypothetical protein